MLLVVIRGSRPCGRGGSFFCDEEDAGEARAPLKSEDSETKQYGLMLYLENAFGDQPNYQQYNKARVEDFFVWLIDREENITGSMFDTAKQFINTMLRGEYYCRLFEYGHDQCVDMPDPDIGKSRNISQLRSKARKKRAELAMINMEDIQADIDNDFSKKQWYNMMTSILDIDPNSEAYNIPNINRCLFGGQFCSGLAECRRNEEYRKLRSVFQFVRTVDKIGPEGTPCMFRLCNEAKHNKEGLLEYIAHAPHINGLLDASFWIGLLWLERFVANGEPIPNFQDYKEVFDLFVYRSEESPKLPLSAATVLLIFKAFFKDGKLDVAKITHILRIKGEQMLDMMGVSRSNIARMAGQGYEYELKTGTGLAIQLRHYI